MQNLTALYQIFQKHPKISTDSRQIPEGGIFFALRGEKFDGNQFALQALRDGAAFAVVDDAQLPTQERLILVENTLLTLQELAKMHRKTFDIPVIGIAGSNGKTTTKELIGAILSSQYPCHVTKGNLNNHIGVPLTLLAMPRETEVAVIEIGANHIGEVWELSQIAQPTHGLLTNIGKEHLEGFGNLEGVKKAESELYWYLEKNEGLAFINLDEKYLLQLAKKVKRKICYRQSEQPNPKVIDLETQLLTQNPLLKVAFLDENGQKITVQSHLFGKHNFHNIQTAIALGRYFKVPAEKIKAAIENYTPKNNRSQVLKIGSNTLLLDAYNANPSSMRAVLQTLAEMAAPHKVAIIGDMLELGAASQREHRSIYNFAVKCQFDRLVLVGEAFGRLKIKDGTALQLPDAATAKKWFAAQSFEQTLILAKASRGIRLEQVFE